jgi:hypothetical protein
VVAFDYHQAGTFLDIVDDHAQRRFAAPHLEATSDAHGGERPTRIEQRLPGPLDQDLAAKFDPILPARRGKMSIRCAVLIDAGASRTIA